jgi:CBS domain-containing protein
VRHTSPAGLAEPPDGTAGTAGARAGSLASSLEGAISMNVRDGMTKVILSVGPAHTLREAARQMSAHRVGAAVVTDAEHPGIGILTERDILDSVGAGQDPDAELVADHRTDDVVFAAPGWTLEQAAAAMAAGGFRHLIVIEAGEVAGLLSMRDIVRCWAGSDRRARREQAAAPAS